MSRNLEKTLNFLLRGILSTYIILLPVAAAEEGLEGYRANVPDIEAPSDYRESFHHKANKAKAKAKSHVNNMGRTMRGVGDTAKYKIKKYRNRVQDVGEDTYTSAERNLKHMKKNPNYLEQGQYVAEDGLKKVRRAGRDAKNRAQYEKQKVKRNAQQWIESE